MGATALGALLKKVRLANGWSLGEMAYVIGRVPGTGKPLNPTGQKRLEEGQRRITEDLVVHLIDKLGPYGLDPEQAWRAAFPEVARALRMAGPFRDGAAVAHTLPVSGSALKDQLASRKVPVVVGGRRRRADRILGATAA